MLTTFNIYHQLSFINWWCSSLNCKKNNRRKKKRKIADTVKLALLIHRQRNKRYIMNINLLRLAVLQLVISMMKTSLPVLHQCISTRMDIYIALSVYLRVMASYCPFYGFLLPVSYLQTFFYISKLW